MKDSTEEKIAHEKVYVIIGWLITLVQIVISGVTLFMVNKADLLPTKIMAILAVVLVVLIVVCRLLMKRKVKRVRFIIGVILAALMSVCLIFADGKVAELTNTLQDITDVQEETTRMGVYVLKDDAAATIQDAAGYRFGILKENARTDTDNAVAQIQEALQGSIATSEYTGISDLADALRSGDSKAIVVNEDFIDMVSEIEGYEGFSDEVKEIASYTWKSTVKKYEDDTAQNKDVFTMYISGIDTFGDISTKSRSDVNILAVVNTKTKQVLLVSTPRDYYVPLSISGGVKDKLTHAGIYGIDVSKDTLEDLYGMKVDYYFRINFSGFEQIIDALGGITVQSDYTFDVAPSFHYEKGSNEVNGIEALAFARERHAFAEGDRQRGKDQMAVITGVIQKMQTPAVLQNFSGLMQGLQGSFESDIPYETLAGLVKEQLSDGGSWNVSSYSVDGTGTKASTYSISKPVYVMIPDQTTVEKAKTMIQQVAAGETVSTEE